MGTVGDSMAGGPQSVAGGAQSGAQNVAGQAQNAGSGLVGGAQSAGGYVGSLFGGGGKQAEKK